MGILRHNNTEGKIKIRKSKKEVIKQKKKLDPLECSHFSENTAQR